GGTIVVEAALTVSLDTAAVIALGDDVGGIPCSSGSGACGSGGHISVRSFQANITWQNGEGDVRPNNGGGTTIGGDITLTACTTVNTTGTNFHGEVPVVNTGVCGGSPTVPSYVLTGDGAGPLTGAGFNTDAPIWEACAQRPGGSKSGLKWNDLNHDGV